MTVDSQPPHTEPSTQKFLVTSQREDDHLLVSIQGELDLSTVSDVEDVARGIEGTGIREVTVDLSEMSFVDSSGLLTLLNFDARAKRMDCELTLKNPTPWAARLFEMLDLQQRINIVGSGEQPGAPND